MDSGPWKQGSSSGCGGSGSVCRTGWLGAYYGGQGKRWGQRATSYSSHPPPTALNKQKGTLYNTKYTGKSFPPRPPPTGALDFAEWEGQIWRKGLGLPASDAVPSPFPRSWDGGRQLGTGSKTPTSSEILRGEVHFFGTPGSKVFCSLQTCELSQEQVAWT